GDVPTRDDVLRRRDGDVEHARPPAQCGGQPPTGGLRDAAAHSATAPGARPLIRRSSGASSCGRTTPPTSASAQYTAAPTIRRAPTPTLSPSASSAPAMTAVATAAPATLLQSICSGPSSGR